MAEMYSFGRSDPGNIFGRAEAASIIRRLSDLYHAKMTQQAPETDAPFFIDVANFVDPELFALEKQKFFREIPLMMGLSCEAPNPGDYLTNDYTGTPIIVIRNMKGELNAFLNACRHRAAKLKTEERGNQCNQLVCPFHGWSFDLDGKLLRVFTENKFGQIDKEAHGLIRLPVAEKYGMIFVRPMPGDPIDIDAHLGSELVRQLKGWNMGALHPFARREFTLPSNWKLALDTYFESYHSASLHATTLFPFSTPETQIYDYYGPDKRHFRVASSIPGIEKVRDMPEEDWNVLDCTGFLYFIFPNVILTLGGFGLNYFEIYPGQTPGDQITSFRHFSPTNCETPEDRERTENWFNFIYSVINDEDYEAVRNIYKGLSSGLHPYSILGRNEMGLINMHRNFRASLGLDPESIRWKSQNLTGRTQPNAAD